MNWTYIKNSNYLLFDLDFLREIELLFYNCFIYINRKYEEIYPPEVGEFVYITDDTYTKTQVIKMENLILRVLSFDLTVPTHFTFLMEYCINNNLSDKIKFLAMVSFNKHKIICVPVLLDIIYFLYRSCLSLYSLVIF